MTRYTDSVAEDDSTSFAIAFLYNVHFKFLELKMAALQPFFAIQWWVQAALLGPVTDIEIGYTRCWK